jgi:hypothetical protein
MALVLWLATLDGFGAQYCPPAAFQASCTSVLVIDWSHESQYGVNMQAKLRMTGDFSTVDLFDATRGTPTLSKLSTYNAVLVFGAQGLYDAAALGDRLASYHNQGGGVVVAGLANHASYSVQGAWRNLTNGYALLDYSMGVWSNSADSLGDRLEPTSPLLTGVASFSASPFADRTIGSVISGGVVVAKWSSGSPFVVRGVRGSRTLVELTFYAAYVDIYRGWSGDGMVLIRNALKYSRCMLCGTGTYVIAGVRGGALEFGRGGANVTLDLVRVCVTLTKYDVAVCSAWERACQNLPLLLLLSFSGSVLCEQVAVRKQWS